MDKIEKLKPIIPIIIASIIVIIFLAIAAGFLFEYFGEQVFLTSLTFAEIVMYIASAAVFFIILIPLFLFGFKKLSLSTVLPFLSGDHKVLVKKNTANDNVFVSDIIQIYGRRGIRHLKIHLLIGASSAVEKIAPRLTTDRWQECDGTLLIYGGDVRAVVDEELVTKLTQLRRRRPLDGVIWVTENTLSVTLLDNQSTFNTLTTANTDKTARYLHHLFQALKWQAPMWVWCVSEGQAQDCENTPAVLCFNTPSAPAQALSNNVLTLLPALTAQGTLALLQHQTHTYLLTLAQCLRQGGSQQLATGLAPLYSEVRALPFCGLAFSAAVPSIQAPSTQANPIPHTWQPDNRWQTWIAAQSELASVFQPAPRGFRRQPIMQYTVATAMALWGIGMVVSFFANRQLMLHSQHAALVATNPQLNAAERLQAQYDFQQTLGQLAHRERTLVPLWLRFGLNQNDALLAQLWPVYQHTLLPLLRDAVSKQLAQQLTRYAQFPPNSTARAEATQPTYQALKAYLMMASPERMAPDFFTDTLLTRLPPPAGVTPGEWQSLGKALLLFYATELPKHPDWAIAPNRSLVNSSRTLLIRQIGQRSGESALYQAILQQAKHSFADITLNEMTGETDVSFLFTTEAFVPGMFTRKAWEESIEPAIKRTVEQRRDEIDWVLSDSQHALDSDITPEQLRQRLTERYFADFAASWLDFLNSLQWRPANSLSESIDQLALMSDIRQSPVIALMNTLAYQGKTGQQSEKLSDSLVNSAKELINKEKKPVINQRVEFTGPLDAVFGPVLNLVDPLATDSPISHNLSLQAYLTRITRVRLKLQQVVNAPDPQAMSQALAQSVFEGKTVDLAKTRDYGSLLAASLGQEWHDFGENVFVAPMAQAWQQLLTPTADGINREWQNAIVNEWNTAFAGRYPLKNTQSDVSLPLMAQYLRPDNGRIQRFLETRLNGVLRKEGHHWVPNATYAQGLRFNPEFLKALNTLSTLGDVVFANGEARVYFDLRPGTHKSVMQTRLVIDKQPLVYDNQFPEWQRFVWPADTIATGSSLSWMTTSAGTRLYADYPGVWGLIRLLETATVTPYAGTTSSYTVSWQTLGGLTLSYTLRTEMGEGPLALLALRNFTLPEKIFLD